MFGGTHITGKHITVTPVFAIYLSLKYKKQPCWCVHVLSFTKRYTNTDKGEFFYLIGATNLFSSTLLTISALL